MLNIHLHPQAELNKLKKELATVTKTHATQTRHLSTTTAELTAAKAKVHEHEGTIQALSADLDLRDSELKRLQQAGAQDDDEVKQLTKARVTLELRVKQLETQLRDAQEQEREGRKQRKKVGPLEEEVASLRVGP